MPNTILHNQPRSSISVKGRQLKKSSRTELILLQLIHAYQPISRVELSERSRLVSSTITVVVSSLIEKGLVVEEVAFRRETGRTATGLRLQSTLGYVVGIDLGMCNFRIVVTDLNGHVFVERHTRSQIDWEPLKLLETCFHCVRELLVESRISHRNLLAIGFTVSDDIDVNLHRRYAEKWQNILLGKIVEQEFEVPCLIENNIQAAATCEKFIGAAGRFDNFVYIDVGMSIDASIFIGGQIYRGFTGRAGDFGHVIIDRSGLVCICGNNGCLETVASGAAVIKSVQASIQRGVASIVQKKCAGNLSCITLEMVAEAAYQDDSLAYRTLREAAIQIGTAAADLINLLNPEAVIFGGALFRFAPDILLPQVRHTVHKRALERSLSDVLLTRSELPTNASAIGMARMASAMILSSLLDRKRNRRGNLAR